MCPDANPALERTSINTALEANSATFPAVIVTLALVIHLMSLLNP
jgi:hypothetical protein